MKTSFTEEQAVALMSFVNDNGWCEDARAVRILLWFEFPGAPELLRDYTSKDGSYVRGYYDGRDWTFYVKSFLIGDIEWSDPNGPRPGYKMRHSLIVPPGTKQKMKHNGS